MARRTILALLIPAISLAIVALAMPRVAVACTCIATQPMAVYATEPETVILTGVTEPPDPRGFPVRVTRWFKGDGLAPRIWMAASGFDGNSASCGIAPPPVGVEWIVVGYRIPDQAELIVNMCAPHHPVGSVEGTAMLADATATFEGSVLPVPTLPPTGPAGDEPMGGVLVILPALLATMLGATGLILGVYAITSRRRQD